MLLSLKRNTKCIDRHGIRVRIKRGEKIGTKEEHEMLLALKKNTKCIDRQGIRVRIKRGEKKGNARARVSNLISTSLQPLGVM